MSGTCHGGSDKSRWLRVNECQHNATEPRLWVTTVTPLTGTPALFHTPTVPRLQGELLGSGMGDALGAAEVGGTSQGKDIRGQVRRVLHATPQGSGVLQSLLDALRLLLAAKRLLITVSAQVLQQTALSSSTKMGQGQVRALGHFQICDPK